MIRGIRRIRRKSRGVWADFRHRVAMASATALLIVVICAVSVPS